MVKKPIIGIVGIGMVGAQLRRYFELMGFERKKNLLCFDTDPAKKCSDDIASASIIFICVPTPSRSDGRCDTSIVESVIAKYASPERVLVIKSTVEPATCERFAKKYRTQIFFNPEFLTESRAWEDMINPDRQVVGHTTSAEYMSGILLNLLPRAFFSSPGTLGTYRFSRINATEAELGKYAGNVFGAMKVVFGNIFADLCRVTERILERESITASVEYENVRLILGHDRRIGDAWLDVSHGNYRGYGGYCFPKDTNALIAFARLMVRALPHASSDQKLLDAGVKVFEAMRDYNRALLASQGLTEAMVNRHDTEFAKKLKKIQKKRR